MKIIKSTNAYGNVAIWVKYPFCDHKSNVREIFETDIQSTLKIFNSNSIGAQIRRDEMWIKYGSRGRKLKCPFSEGLMFSFSVPPEKADLFDETVFALMR